MTIETDTEKNAQAIQKRRALNGLHIFSHDKG